MQKRFPFLTNESLEYVARRSVVEDHSGRSFSSRARPDDALAALFAAPRRRKYRDCLNTEPKTSAAVRWSIWPTALGRLVVVEAMKYFVARGVRHFDMGIGDYPFKRGFGVEDVPLYDLIVARDLSAVPRALFHRLKGRLRQNKLARAVYQRWKPVLKR